MPGPFNGVRGAIKQPSRWGRNEAGNYETWAFEGTANEVRAVASLLAQTPGLSYEVIEGFGKFRLEVKFPWNADGYVDPATDRVDLWELFSQHAEKDLLESQDNAGLVKTLSLRQKEKIRQLLLVPDSTTAKAATDFRSGSETIQSSQNALTIYQLMQSGMKSYLMPAPALRHTIVTSSQYAIGYALTNVKKLISTSTLITSEAIPSGLLFNINSYFGGDVSTDALLVYGWFKTFPTIQQIAMLKYQIVQEWVYGWWPLAVYGTPL